MTCLLSLLNNHVKMPYSQDQLKMAGKVLIDKGRNKVYGIIQMRSPVGGEF